MGEDIALIETRSTKFLDDFDWAAMLARGVCGAACVPTIGWLIINCRMDGYRRSVAT